MDPIFYAAAIPAVFLHGLSKGGFSGLGMVSLPLMALVVPPLQGAAIIMPILMVQDIIPVWTYRKTCDWALLKMYLPGTFAGLVAGACLASYVSDAMVQLLVGIIAAIFVITYWLRKAPSKDDPPKVAKRSAATFWGLLSGFTSFIANAGGVPFQAFAIPLRLAPTVFAGTATFLFVSINWTKFALFLLIGQVSTENMMISATLLPVAVAATYVGVWLVKRIEARYFYRIVTTTTFILGLKLIWDGARDMGWI